MNKKTVITLASVFSVFVVLAFLMGKVYKIGQDRPPLKYATIPESTQRFIKGLIRMGGHMAGVDIVEGGGPYDWENGKDVGQREGENWSREEDEFFIVYYKKDKEAVWQGHAQNILQAANENILPLTRLMGKYYYPADQNGRKLPIYLATSPQEYSETASKLLESPYRGQGSIGVTISQLGGAGCKASIVIHPICFQCNPRANNGYVTVLLHEMNHYVFMSSLDLSQDVAFCNWQVEGLADYCANTYVGNIETSMPEARIQYIDKYCSLLKDFPSETIAEYWAGESYFRYMEDAHGDTFVKDFIQATFKNTTEKTFSAMNIDPDDEHTGWVRSLRNNISREE